MNFYFFRIPYYKQMELQTKKWTQAFREQHGIGHTDPIRLKSLLIKLNVVTVFKALPAGFSGMAVKIGAHRFMMVNCLHSLGKQHFTICHELYHLFVQDNFTAQSCQTGLFDPKKDKEEYRADLFAAYLLLPEDGLLDLIPAQELKKDKITMASLLRLEQYYACSRSALLYRLRSLKLISPDFYEAHKQGVKAGALMYGYPISLYEPGNQALVLGNYGETARQLFETDRISESHYLSLMRDIGIDLWAQMEQQDG